MNTPSRLDKPETTGNRPEDCCDNLRQHYRNCPFAYQSLDIGGNLIEVNRAWLDLFGYTREEIIGKPFAEILLPDWQELFRKNFELIGLVAETAEGELRALRQDGADISISYHGWKVGGSEIATHWFIRDTTRRKRPEERLEAKLDQQEQDKHIRAFSGDQLLDNLARLVPGVIYQYRLYPDGRSAFPYSSPGMNLIYEVKPEEVREDATPVFGRLHPEDHDRVAEAIFASANTLETFYCEFRVILPRQGLRWRWSQAQPQRTEDGGTLWHGIILDVTERKQAEEERKRLTDQLQQAQKMEAIGTLAGGIAHDFNNILSAILGYAELAHDQSPAGSHLADDIEQILKAGNRAKELVSQILAFSRRGKSDLIVLKPVSIIKEAVKLLRASLPTTISIKEEIDQEAGAILADPSHIHQILMNLCTNAFHAMEMNGGTLTVSLQNVTVSDANQGKRLQVRPGEYLQLSVRDTGEGISPAIREKIFDPYFTTKEVGKGTGMGLAMVHGIVKSYGGFITYDSRLGEGTVFHVGLPAVRDLPPEESEASEPVSAGKGHILFIDDEKMLAKMGKSMLERLGYRVTARTNSLEALNDFLDDPDRFDLVVTDQTMPGMTGADLARRMLRLRPEMPIILCTGYSNLITEDKAKSIGIKGFATKPLSMKSLTALIRRVLDEKTPHPPKG